MAVENSAMAKNKQQADTLYVTHSPPTQSATVIWNLLCNSLDQELSPDRDPVTSSKSNKTNSEWLRGCIAGPAPALNMTVGNEGQWLIKVPGSQDTRRLAYAPPTQLISSI
jgi:hypothetical protein